MSQVKCLTDNIFELDAAEHDLEINGISRSQIHVLSRDDEALAEHDLPPFSEWAKRDIIFYASRGAVLGAGLASLILLAGLLYGGSDVVGWMVLIFLAIGVMGFCTWEGGLMGIARLNHHFDRYGQALAEGKHLMVVEVNNAQQERTAHYTINAHPPLHLVD